MATEDVEVNSMPQGDNTPKYLEGFQNAVRRLLGPKVNGWSSALYTNEDAIEQALRKAYWEGRFDGVDSVLGHPAAPAAPEVDEEPLETVGEAWERLGLFEAAAAPPGRISDVVRPVLAPLDGDPYAWAIRQARATLNFSLVEAAEFVQEVLG